MRNREGFTLLELMLVTVIIGVLASLAVASYGGLRERAKLAAVRTELRNALTASELYRSVHGVLPESMDALLAAGFHRRSEYVDYCVFSRDPGPPEDLHLEAAHRGSSTHLVAHYPSQGVEMQETTAASDCS